MIKHDPTINQTAENQLHPKDSHMLMMQSPGELSKFSSGLFKGGIAHRVMPEDVAEFLLTARDDTLEAMCAKAVDINPSTGEPQWDTSDIGDVPKCLKDFADSICPAFNKAGDRNATFSLSLNKGTEASIFPIFHFDTKNIHDHDTLRAVMAVSNDGLDHETEWIACDGLDLEDLDKLLLKKTLSQDFAPELAQHIEHIGQRDMIMMRGLSIHNKDALTGGVAHRSPPFKNGYPEAGLRRVNIILDETIDWGNDFHY